MEEELDSLFMPIPVKMVNPVGVEGTGFCAVGAEVDAAGAGVGVGAAEVGAGAAEVGVGAADAAPEFSIPSSLSNSSKIPFLPKIVS